MVEGSRVGFEVLRIMARSLGLGFGVLGFGFGFRVWGVGFRDCFVGFWVLGLGRGVLCLPPRGTARPASVPVSPTGTWSKLRG